MWQFHCSGCNRIWYAKTQSTTCHCGQTLVSDRSALPEKPDPTKLKDLPRSYSLAFSAGLMFLLALAIAFWFVPTTAVYGLTWIVLWVTFARERVWHWRFHNLQATVCEYVNNIEPDSDWLSQENDSLVSSLIGLNYYLQDRFGDEDVRNAGIRRDPPYEPFHEDRGCSTGDDRDGDDDLSSDHDARDETDTTQTCSGT